MTNTSNNNNGNEGSSSRVPPQSPVRGSSSPRGRSSQRPTGGRQSAPAMGVRGRSAFTPYVRPPPPPPSHWVSPGSSHPSGSGSAGGFGLQGALAVPVGGSGSGGVAAPGLQYGGNPAARKRVRDGVVGAGAGAGNPAVPPPNNEVNCSLCGKVFLTPKALFGHMRSHQGRGWKGARPPPTFNAEEEFADFRVGQIEAAAEEGGGGVPPEDEEEGKNYKVPDLNNPPPEDSA